MASTGSRPQQRDGDGEAGEGGRDFDAEHPFDDDLVASNVPSQTTSPDAAGGAKDVELGTKTVQQRGFLHGDTTTNADATAKPSPVSSSKSFSRLVSGIFAKDVSKSAEDPNTTTTAAARPRETRAERQRRLRELGMTSSAQGGRRRQRNSAARFVKEAAMVVTTEVMNEGSKVAWIMKTVVLKFWVPCAGLSAVLYYGFDNPKGPLDASISWWILFVAIRLMLTLFCSLFLEHILTDVLSIRSRFSQRVFGPFVALCIVQANGWAATLILWSILNFGLLHGSNSFAQHWLFWQDAIELFNEKNTSGNVLDAEGYTNLLTAAVVMGILVTMKRVAFAFYSEKHFYERYSSELFNITKQVEMVRKVAVFAAENAGRGSSAELSPSQSFDMSGHGRNDRGKNDDDEMEEEWAAILEDVFAELDNPGEGNNDDDEDENGEVPSKRDQKDEKTKQRIADIVGEGDGMDDIRSAKKTEVTAEAILNLRQAVANLDDRYPFSPAYGVAKTRQECVTSALKIYRRLLTSQSSSGGKSHVLTIRSLSGVIADSDGVPQFDQLKALVRVFRPDRDGNLTADAFSKCCLSVHSEIKQFRQTVDSTTQMDKELEKFLGLFFYVVLVVVVLGIMRVALLPLALTFSGLVLSIAFLFGTAAARCFEGIITVFLERPFNVGDRISVVPIDRVDGSYTHRGTHQWIVSKVTLFKSTLVYTETGEVASVPNSLFSTFKIINCNLNTPMTVVKLVLKFNIDTPFAKVKVFKQHVEQYVKDRPNEWVRVSYFRSGGVDQQRGYIGFSMGLIHREKWQALQSIRESELYVNAFANELAKAMNMRFTLPPQPIVLETTDSDIVSPTTYDDGTDELDPETLKKAIALFDETKKTK